MKVNWKVRVKNVQFWIQVFLSIAVPIGAYFGIVGPDITSWPILFGLIKDAALNPYVVFMIIVSIYNAVLDPTTKGIKDSAQALSYTEPKEDK